MIDSNIKERLELLDSSYKEFVTSNFASEAAINLGKELKLDEDKIAVLSNGIVLYLLVFINFEELTAFISTECEIPSSEAAKVAGAVVASLPEQFSIAHTAAFTLVSETKVTKDDMSSEIMEAEEVLRAIPTVKTMAQDMRDSSSKSEPTYSNTQEAILKEGRGVSK